MKKKIIMAIMSVGFVLLAGCGSSKTVTIKPVGNEMKYEKIHFIVEAGQKITLVMDNVATAEAMKHNVVVLTDSSFISEVGMAAITEPDYIPEHSAILAATPIAGAGEKTQVTFTAPSEPGNYPFICTYPGHYTMMSGVMIVR